MKIKGKIIIPLIAVIIAMFTVGVIPGAASDTTATEISDSLTYVPSTFAPTSSLEEEVEGMVSDLLGDTLQDAEGPVRGFSVLMESVLTSIKNVLNSIISFFESVGGMMGGSSDGFLGGMLG